MSDVFVRVTYEWDAPASGTGPFTSGLWLVGTDASPLDDLDDLIDTIATDAWDEIKGSIWEGVGNGTCTGKTFGAATVHEHTHGVTGATGGGQTRGPGQSFRCLFAAPRPPRGRQNGCYFPLPDNATYNPDGVVGGGVSAHFSDWAGVIIDAEGPVAWRWVSRYGIDSDGLGGTHQEVTDAQLAPTISWLQRRYR